MTSLTSTPASPLARTVARVPASFFGMVLGLFGLGSAWRYAAHLGLAPSWVGEVGVATACTVWLVLAVVYGLRCVLDRPGVLAECRDVHASSFVVLLPAGAVLVAVGVRPYGEVLADVLLVAGVLGQLAFSAVRVAPLWGGGHPPDAATPGFYLPLVAANLISAIGLADAHQPELATLFLGAGAVSWLTLEPAILHRLRTGTTLPPRARAVIGVQVAPAFVVCFAYLAIDGNRVDTVALALFGYGVLQLVFALRLARWFLAGGFSPGLWAFSFGFAAMANCALRLQDQTASLVVRVLAWAVFGTADVLLVALAAGTVVALARGRLLPATAPGAAHA